MKEIRKFVQKSLHEQKFVAGGGGGGRVVVVMVVGVGVGVCSISTGTKTVTPGILGRLGDDNCMPRKFSHCHLQSLEHSKLIAPFKYLLVVQLHLFSCAMELWWIAINFHILEVYELE